MTNPLLAQSAMGRQMRPAPKGRPRSQQTGRLPHCGQRAADMPTGCVPQKPCHMPNGNEAQTAAGTGLNVYLKNPDTNKTTL